MHISPKGALSTHCRWLATVLALSALTACATTAPTASGSVASAPAATEATAAPRQRGYVTGSRIAVPVDARTGLPAADPRVQVVTQDDLNTDSRDNLARELRALVPVLH